MIRSINRRAFLKGLAATTTGALIAPKLARADLGGAQRVIIFYFPDGVPGPSQDGDPSEWHTAGSESDFSLPSVLSSLEPHKSDCLFMNGLSMGGTDSGSHPGGAKKLLTGVDGGNGWSIDHYLGQTAGSSSPHRHVYLGAMANHNNASGDKHVVYVGPGQTIAPEDDPRAAFERLFGTSAGEGGAGVTPATNGVKTSVIDGALAELNAFKARLGNVEASKLDFHLESLRELEQRIKAEPMVPAVDNAGCDDPHLAPEGVATETLYDPTYFPDVLKAQIDLMVMSMACGLTKVGTIQCSHHTSELIMSRFPGTEMHDPNYDMRSHQASHYGPVHDEGKIEYRHYVQQRRWYVSQFAYLLEQLKSRPEGDGTMLDNSLVLMCTEVCDGNTHLHDNMPFIVAGKAGGAVSTGRRLDFGYRRHSDLLVSIARAMGEDIWSYGDASSGPLW